MDQSGVEDYPEEHSSLDTTTESLHYHKPMSETVNFLEPDRNKTERMESDVSTRIQQKESKEVDQSKGIVKSL